MGFDEHLQRMAQEEAAATSAQDRMTAAYEADLAAGRAARAEELAAAVAYLLERCGPAPREALLPRDPHGSPTRGLLSGGKPPERARVRGWVSQRTFLSVQPELYHVNSQASVGVRGQVDLSCAYDLLIKRSDGRYVRSSNGYDGSFEVDSRRELVFEQGTLRVAYDYEGRVTSWSAEEFLAGVIRDNLPA